MFSVGHTMTADQALSFIASLFPPDTTGERLNPAMLTELLNRVTPDRPRRKRLK